jgi:nucleotide-binding universal stress UspA family protein
MERKEESDEDEKYSERGSERESDIKIKEEKRQESYSPFSLGHSIDDLHRFYSNLNSSSSSSSTSHPFSGFHYLTLVDGSPSSEIAYQVTLALCKKTDYITLLHSYEPDLQSEIPSQYSAEFLYQKYSQDLSLHLNSKRYKLCWEPSSPTSPLIQTLNSYLQMSREIFSQLPHFIVLGHTGRNLSTQKHHRPQYDSISSPLSFLSSDCDLIVRTIQLPLIIAKNNIPLRREKKTWMMAVDETIYSSRGLDLLLHLLNPKDTLIIFHIFNEVKESNAQLTKIENNYEEKLMNYGPTFHQFRFIQQERGVGLADCIVNYVQQNQPDLFALAPRARDDDFSSLTLSPITEYVLNQVRCSIVVCKNDG